MNRPRNMNRLTVSNRPRIMERRRRPITAGRKVLAVAALVLLASSVSGQTTDAATEAVAQEGDYRGAMRSFVVGIAQYARQEAGFSFVVIPQNGHELLTLDGEPDGPIARGYVEAIDGVGREDLYYGYVADNRATPAGESRRIVAFMDRAESVGVQVLVTDYVWTRRLVDNSYAQSADRGYASFAADRRDLDSVPSYPSEPIANNPDSVSSLDEAKNFLYLLDPGQFADAGALISAIDQTNYDMFIIDAFVDDTMLSHDQVARLQSKPNGARRLVIAYMSVGEAEEYRYYWRDEWSRHPPPWLDDENPNWEGNFKVRYWDPEWHSVIYGQPDSYLNRILAAGFDGVYLDIIDAFEHFE